MNQLEKEKFVLMGPMVDVELVDQVWVPDGVNISILHFLNTAECEDVRQETESNGHSHHILKISDRSGDINVEKIDSISSLQNSFLTTNKFQGRNLCVITTATDGEQIVQCSHSSIQRFYVTKQREDCPHDPGSLGVYCVCEINESKARFDDIISCA